MSEDFEKYFKDIAREQNLKQKGSKTKKGKSALDVDITDTVKKFLPIFFTLFFVILILYFGIKTFNIKQKLFISGSNYAYKVIQAELTEYYKKNGYVYKSKDEKTDDFCQELGRKYSKYQPDCSFIGGIAKTNFVFKGKKIEIIGMEQPPFERMGTLVKDFIIDVNGTGKGEDEIGTDRVPVRIYSTGMMGGRLSPVNCNHQDLLDYELEYADICHNCPEINFMATKIPFGYDITQIKDGKGKNTLINRDVPFLRADCVAFGGDMAMLDEYCERKGMSWHKACYDDAECTVEISRKKIR